MSLADWTLATNFGGVHVEPPALPIIVDYPDIDVFNPDSYRDGMGNLVDIGVNSSKCLVMSSAGTGTLRWAAAVNTGAEWQVIRGRIRAELKMHSIHNGPGNLGIIALLSQDDLEPGNGAQGYMVSIDSLFFETRVYLLQMLDGVSASPGGALGSTYEILGESAAGAWTFGEKLIMELRFHSDPVELKGVQLQLFFQRPGKSLRKMFDVVYTGSIAYKPTMSAGCAIGCGMGTNSLITYVDNVQIYGEP